MELHRLRATQVSAAQPLNIIYHRRQKLSNGFLVVLIVYAFLFVVILFVINIYPYTQSPFLASSTVHADIKGYNNVIAHCEQMFHIFLMIMNNYYRDSL